MTTLLKAYPGIFSNHPLQMLSCMTRVIRRNLCWSALGDYRSATLAATRAEVEDPVGALDDVEMVFDDDDRVAVPA
jgi:hypothetical protein